jgi:hypothetical protein
MGNSVGQDAELTLALVQIEPNIVHGGRPPVGVRQLTASIPWEAKPPSRAPGDQPPLHPNRGAIR